MKILLSLTMCCVVAASFTVHATATTEYQSVAGRRIDTENAVMTASSSGITLSVRSEKKIRFYIYSITGQLIKTVDVVAGESEYVDLNRGCYIVKCSDWSKKVLVK
ncbi:T9SS C-terminal target domain-containing protein [Muribaculaceae bacterium Isolate-104 (HZI)]|nr:T9SS C-terminal target domain-containing protein [Muribaculaceae bacterium Isolate-104 (HZI)]